MASFETSFVFVGLMGGFAYLAWRSKKDVLAYGIGLAGLGFAFQGFESLAGAASSTALPVLRNMAFGAGLALLGYVGAMEGYRAYAVRTARRRADAAAFQLRLAADADASTSKRSPSGR